MGVVTLTPSPWWSLCINPFPPLQANLSGLPLDTVYSVSVAVRNSNGTGPSSAPISVRTLQQGGEEVLIRRGGVGL